MENMQKKLDIKVALAHPVATTGYIRATALNSIKRNSNLK